MTIHDQLPLALPAPPIVRLRSVRRPFNPSQPAGPYRLPPAILERLSVALAPYRNRSHSLDLAVFVARYWSVPRRLGLPFPCDRRALADHDVLGLTEGQIRGAIKTLVQIGYLDRDPEFGSLYQRPSARGPRKKPCLYRLGTAYLADFQAANRRSETRPSSSTQLQARRILLPSASRPVVPFIKPTSRSEGSILKGENTGTASHVGQREQEGSPKRSLAVPLAGPPEPSPLELALARLGRALLHPGANSSEGVRS